MTHEEILQGLYDNTLVGNAPEVKDLTNAGLESGLDPEKMLYDALARIDAVLPSQLRHELHDNAFHVGRRPAQPQSVDLAMPRKAMREQRKMRIVYADPSGKRSERVIWPIMLGFLESRRYIAGWCELRDDFRMFRADRIERAKVLSERYTPSRRTLVREWRAKEDARKRAS